MTSDQRAALATFRSLVGSRIRVTADAEGWPVALGRYGQIEWHSDAVVAIYSQTMRMLARLALIPGVRRHQIGDQEFRLLLSVHRENVHQKQALGVVAKLLHVRTRHVLSERQEAVLLAGQFRARAIPETVQDSHEAMTSPPQPARLRPEEG